MADSAGCGADFDVPFKPLKVHLSVSEDESLRLIVASSTGFFSIDVTSGSLVSAMCRARQASAMLVLALVRCVFLLVAFYIFCSCNV